MIGFIIGDILGSGALSLPSNDPTEFNFKTKDKYTHVSVLTVSLADVLLSKFVFDDFSDELESASLYRSRIDYFTTHALIEIEDMNLPKQLPLFCGLMGYYSDSIDRVQEEVRHCVQTFSGTDTQMREAEIIACCILLGQFGVSKEALSYFLKAEYDFTIDTEDSSLGKALTIFMQSEDFEQCLVLAVQEQNNRHEVLVLTAGIAHSFFQSIPDFRIDLVQAALEEDLKRVMFSFMKTFNVRY
ncbi:MAG: hypothetical protein ACRCST_12855 [Turicibacter sp.]